MNKLITAQTSFFLIKVGKIFPLNIRRAMRKVYFKFRGTYFKLLSGRELYSLDYDLKVYAWGHIAECLIFEDFEPYTRNFLSKHIKVDDILINVGSNVGLFAIYAALKAKDGKVYAIEANTETFEKLNDNIRLNSLKNVHADNVAISDFNGVINLFAPMSGRDSEFSVSTVQSTAEKAGSQVTAVTLDKYIEQHNINSVSGLIIDVEGHELQLLRGASMLFKLNSLRYISIELTKSVDECLDIMKFFGFTIESKQVANDQEFKNHAGQYFLIRK